MGPPPFWLALAFLFSYLSLCGFGILFPRGEMFADVIESLDPLPARDISRRSFILPYRLRFMRAAGSYIKGMIVQPPSE